MSIDLQLTPKTKRPAGQPCEPVVYPDVEREHAVRMASVAKALGDPVRIQLIDVLRKHAGKVCVCELVPLFDLSQPTVSHHLKVLRQAGLVGSERQGLWAYYYVLPEALEELSAWLHDAIPSRGAMNPALMQLVARQRRRNLHAIARCCDVVSARPRSRQRRLAPELISRLVHAPAPRRCCA